MTLLFYVQTNVSDLLLKVNNEQLMTKQDKQKKMSVSLQTNFLNTIFKYIWRCNKQLTG